jgi:hypothetical protein
MVKEIFSAETLRCVVGSGDLNFLKWLASSQRGRELLHSYEINSATELLHISRNRTLTKWFIKWRLDNPQPLVDHGVAPAVATLHTELADLEGQDVLTTTPIAPPLVAPAVVMFPVVTLTTPPVALQESNIVPPPTEAIPREENEKYDFHIIQ